jgi:hypothetical protein
MTKNAVMARLRGVCGKFFHLFKFDKPMIRFKKGWRIYRHIGAKDLTERGNERWIP